MIHFLKKLGKNSTVLEIKKNNNKVYKLINSSPIIFPLSLLTVLSKILSLFFNNKQQLNHNFKTKMYFYKIRWKNSKTKVQIILNKLNSIYKINNNIKAWQNNVFQTWQEFRLPTKKYKEIQKIVYQKQVM